MAIYKTDYRHLFGNTLSTVASIVITVDCLVKGNILGAVLGAVAISWNIYVLAGNVYRTKEKESQ